MRKQSMKPRDTSKSIDSIGRRHCSQRRRSLAVAGASSGEERNDCAIDIHNGLSKGRLRKLHTFFTLYTHVRRASFFHPKQSHLYFVYHTEWETSILYDSI